MSARNDSLFDSAITKWLHFTHAEIRPHLSRKLAALISALAAEAVLYAIVVVIFFLAIYLVLKSNVPPWVFTWKSPVRTQRKPPAWMSVLLLGLALVGLLSFWLNSGAPLIARPQYEQWVAILLYVLVVRLTWDLFTQASGIRAKASIVIIGATVFGVVTLWNLYPNWLTASLLSVLITIWGLYTIQPLWSFLRVTGVLLVVALCYDVVQTLATSSMIRYAERAVTISWPGLIRIPLHITSLTAIQGPAIGAGDLLIPGILAVIAGRIAQRSGARSILWAALIGFAAGVLLALVVVTILDIPQPATIFTVPGVALPVWLTARHNGVQAELRNRQRPGDGPADPPSSPQSPTD